MASTGVIGEPLPREAFSAALTELHPTPAERLAGGGGAAIRTTDTFAKGARRRAKTRQGEIALLGIAKGSGMIAPNMATLLVFLFIDARLDSQRLQTLLNRANKTSFAAISVDSDTSTSDMALAFACGHSCLKAPKNWMPWAWRLRRSAKTWPSRSCATVKAQQSSYASTSKELATPSSQQLARAVAESRWLRRRLRARTPTGVACLWRWARRGYRSTSRN